MNFTKIALVSAVIALGACGKSSGPIVAPQFAQPGDIVGPGSSFATQDVKRFVLVNGTNSLKDQTVNVRISNDGRTVYIEQNHKSFVLVDDGTGTFRGDNAIFLAEVTGSSVVKTMYFLETTPGYLNSGSFVVGYKTDPIEVTRQPGTATYAGYAILNADTPTLFGFGKGPVTLDADFDSGTVTGTMQISDVGATGTTMTIPDTTVTINPGNVPNISGNQFDSNLAFTLTPALGDTASVIQSGMEGAFYGVNAVGIGATYWAIGSFNGENLYLQGALSSN